MVTLPQAKPESPSIENNPVLTTLEPIEKSKIALALPLAMILLCADLLFIGVAGLLFYLFPPNTSFTPFFVLFLELLKSMALLYFVIALLVRWESQTFYITGHHLIERHGVVVVSEKIYELKSLSGVHIEQSWLGQVLNYGTLVLTFYLSRQETVLRIPRIAAPRNYGALIEKYIGLDSQQSN